MNNLLNKNNIKKIILVLFIFAFAKFLGLIAFYFLPKYGKEKAKEQDIAIEFKKYKIEQAFGLIKAQDLPAPKVQKNILKIDNLILLALYHDQQDGIIMFVENTPNSQTQILQKDESYKGYKLIKVEPTRAIFQRDGVQYYLSFKDVATPGGGLPTAEIIKPAIERLTDSKATVSRDEIHKYTSNMQEIWNNIAIREVMTDGKINGFKVLAVKSGSVFDELGLKKGDVIMNVNNETLSSYADAFSIYDNIDKYESIKLEIIRNNQKRELEYEIN